MADRPEMFGPTMGFSGMADSMEPCKMCGRPLLQWQRNLGQARRSSRLPPCHHYYYWRLIRIVINTYSVDESAATIRSLRSNAFVQFIVEVFVVISVLYQAFPLQQQNYHQQSSLLIYLRSALLRDCQPIRNSKSASSFSSLARVGIFFCVMIHH